MNLNLQQYLNKINVARNVRAKWMIAAVILWTILDIYLLTRWQANGHFYLNPENKICLGVPGAWLICSMIVNTGISAVMFYLTTYISEEGSAVYKRFQKTMMVFASICILTAVRFLVMTYFTENISHKELFNNAWNYLLESGYLADAIFIKCLAVFTIHLSHQLGKKYSPGFFINMMIGRYSIPRVEERIIMFVDLKDSTPISERLGHQLYFLFIRDFISIISNAALANGADIYQYVGDEVIVTWPKKKKEAAQCIQTLIMCRKQLHIRSGYFRDKYGVQPEFRVGIHVGEVTIGEIGVVKKEIAMSGEAMNITARIRSACSELHQKHIVSEDYFDYSGLKQWQGEDLGHIPLKGIHTRQLKLYTIRL